MATIGTIAWCDLTIPEAEKVRDFYRDVVGWTSSVVNMGDYSDYSMSPLQGDPVAGICHARGANAKIPPQWLVYITVADLNASVMRSKELGGSVVDGPRSLGSYGTMAVIKDPAGAVCAIVEPLAEQT
ncbi:MAG: VOC family protein [Gemmataceae bacterium]